MGWGRVEERVTLALWSCALWSHAAMLGAQKSPASSAPRFVELPCSQLWGSAQGSTSEIAKCGTVTVPQNRQTPNDTRLVSVVLPVVMYSHPGGNGTPMIFLAGGPGESSIEAVMKVFLDTPTGQTILRERPIIAFDRRGYSTVSDRASPDLGTVLFQPRGRRDLAIAPIKDSLIRRGKELRARGIDPKNFTTIAMVDDIADVARALNINKMMLFGVSYGTHEALLFMRRHPEMVVSAVLDGVAPPMATMVLDSTYMARMGRTIISRIVTECGNDRMCAAQYSDLAHAVASLLDSTSALRRTVLAPVSGDWRTIEVAGASILSVLGIASSAEDVLTSVPRVIMEFVGKDTLADDLSPRVLVAAAIDPSLQTVAMQAIPLVRYIALCGDRPQGEPKAGDRRLCDALGVPFSGPEAIGPVTSDTPTLLISSGYDAQTPAELADSAAKTLSHAQRAHFPTTGHVAVARPLVAPCVAIIVDAFLRRPDQAPPTDCAGKLAPAFMPPAEPSPRRKEH